MAVQTKTNKKAYEIRKEKFKRKQDERRKKAKHQFKKKLMRLVALIIFLIEWKQMELILMGKQWTY